MLMRVEVERILVMVIIEDDFLKIIFEDHLVQDFVLFLPRVPQPANAMQVHVTYILCMLHAFFCN
jgi:hypothetical protein